jgi:hypothetical protein
MYSLSQEDLIFFQSLKEFIVEEQYQHFVGVKPCEGFTFKGQRHTEESKELMRIAAKNQIRKPLSEETKQKISNKNTGKTFKHTEETKTKISKSSKNRKPISEETRKKLSISAKNRKSSNHRKSGTFSHSSKTKEAISVILSNKASRPIVLLIKQLNGSANKRKIKLAKGWWQKQDEELYIILDQLKSLD